MNEMVNIEVSAADRDVLDWLMAKCEGVLDERGRLSDEFCDSLGANDGLWCSSGNLMVPLVEREGIATTPWYRDGILIEWSAKSRGFDHMQFGPTWFFAVARCHIVSKMGEVVEVPRRLIKEEVSAADVPSRERARS